MADEADITELTAPSPDELRRRDAEAALADLYQRVLEVERSLVEGDEARTTLEGKLLVQAAENDQLRARLAELDAELAGRDAQLAAVRGELDGERRARVGAEAEVRAFTQTKVFRAVRVPRQVYARLRALVADPPA